MPNFRIFTESKADIKFITDYVIEHFNVALTQDDFYTLNSWSGYRNGESVIAAIRQNVDNGKNTILILDADSSFIDRESEVLIDFEEYNISISDSLFLFHNNNYNGCLENLLCKIAFNETVLQCFERYENCLQGYQPFTVKSKVYAYLDALLPARNKRNDIHNLIRPEN